MSALPSGNALTFLCFFMVNTAFKPSDNQFVYGEWLFSLIIQCHPVVIYANCSGVWSPQDAEFELTKQGDACFLNVNLTSCRRGKRERDRPMQLSTESKHIGILAYWAGRADFGGCWKVDFFMRYIMGWQILHFLYYYLWLTLKKKKYMHNCRK